MQPFFISEHRHGYGLISQRKNLSKSNATYPAYIRLHFFGTADNYAAVARTKSKSKSQGADLQGSHDAGKQWQL